MARLDKETVVSINEGNRTIYGPSVNMGYLLRATNTVELFTKHPNEPAVLKVLSHAQGNRLQNT